MNAREVDEFEKVEAQIMGFLDEVLNLAKKSPDGAVNTFKLKLINAVLASANKLLKPAQRPFHDFEQFDEVVVPSNSDVLVMLRQYANILEEVRAANIHLFRGDWYWNIKGAENERRARAPAKLKR
ncbi:MAG TPA: hypothetical protein VGJ18_00135 [Gemmatimonadaceae bacterium]|jgi:hypothetical protein